MALLDLGTSGHDDEQRQSGGALGEVLEERDERRVGPVQVLDHQDGGSRRSDLLEEASPRGEGLLALGRFGGGLQAHEGARRSLIQVRVCGSASVSA